MLKEIEKKDIYWSTDPLEELRFDIDSFELLNFEQEITLGRQLVFGKKCKSILNKCLENNLPYDNSLLENIEKGIKAREKLINSNMRLVLKDAIRYSGWTDQGTKIEDHIIHNFFSGCEGLIKAADAFDPERGKRFSTYAVPKIRKAIFENIRWNTIYAPKWIRELAQKYINISQKYFSLNNKLPEDEYLLKELNINQKKLDLVRNSYTLNSGISLDTTENEDVDNDVPLDKILFKYEKYNGHSLDPTEDFVFEKIWKENLNEQTFRVLIDRLDNKVNMMIFIHIFVLEDMEQKQIAEICKVTPQYISAQYRKLLKVLSKNREFVSYCIDYLGLRDYKSNK